MQPSYVILTESSCDLTPELVERAGVEVLPMTFTLEGQSYAHYPDGRNYALKEFYDRLRAGAAPTTAAANVAELSDAMEQHLRSGQDVLFLCFSSGLSSTRDACAMAAAELRERYPERKIETVDTLAATVGQGLLVLRAGELRLSGATLEEVRDRVEAEKLHVAQRFTVDDLSYLRRGGRISTASAAVGTMLQIKPVLHVDDAGRLSATDKVRGRKSALQAILRHMEETIRRPAETVFVIHADCLEEAQALRDKIDAQFSPGEILIAPLGPIIGAHTGPGLLGAVFLADYR